MIDRERFTQARHSCLEPVRSVGKVPVGELSLSGEPECLSLQDVILIDMTKTGKRIGQRYPCAPAPPLKGLAFLPMHKYGGILLRFGEVRS